MKTICWLGLGLLLCCTSCVFYTAPVNHASQVNKSNALLYGRFADGQHYKEEINPNWRTAGLWIKNVDADRTLYVKFKLTNAVYGVQVEPGHYQIMGCVHSDNEHGVKDRKTFSAMNVSAAVTAPFEARSGDQIYIGDYLCEPKLDYPILHWKVKTIADNFGATTLELRRGYPDLPLAPPKSIFARDVSMP